MKKHHTKPYLSVVLFSVMAILFLIVTLALLGCSEEITSPSTIGDSIGSLVISLEWEDAFDSADEMTNINLWVYNKAGGLVGSKEYTSFQSPLDELEGMLAESYRVVIGVNVKDPLQKEHTETIESLIDELDRQAKLYEETYYGEKTAEVVGGYSTPVPVALYEKQRCKRCNAPEPNTEHNYLCGAHACVEGIVADEHKAAACGSEGHFVCDTKDHTTELSCGHVACVAGSHEKLGCDHFACAADGNHEKLDCGHFACSDGNHEGLDCGHFACADGNHAKLDCGHFECSDGNHAKLDCGHFACSDGNHEGLDCGHFACADGNHEKLECGHFECSDGNHKKLTCSDQHWACDEEYGVQDCGHCSCENRHYICPTCGNKSCDDFEYPHEEFYCGHILCGETMEEGHVECEYCGDCVTYGTHGASGCQPPQE